MNEYKSHLTNKGYANLTIREHLRVIKELDIYLDKENITAAEMGYNDVLAYISYIHKKGVSASTQRNRITILKSYFNYQIKQGQRTDNPALDVKLKPSRRTVVSNMLTMEQLDELYNVFLNQPSRTNIAAIAHKRHSIILGLMIYQGLNTTDLKRLLVTDINLEEGIIKLPESKRTNPRIIALEAKQMLPIMQYINTKKGERMFVDSMHNTQAFILKKIAKITGERVTSQQIITSRVVIWLKQYNLRKVQYLCGFKYISSLEKYRVSSVDDLREKLEKCFG